jgi:hypothetical protein
VLNSPRACSTDLSIRSAAPSMNSCVVAIQRSP